MGSLAQIQGSIYQEALFHVRKQNRPGLPGWQGHQGRSGQVLHLRPVCSGQRRPVCGFQRAAQDQDRGRNRGCGYSGADEIIEKVCWCICWIFAEI